MPIPESAKPHSPFEIVPGIGIGPFRLGMTETEVEAICREYGLRNEGVPRCGLRVSFHKGRAVQIDAESAIGLSIAGEEFDSSDDTVRRLLAKIAPPGPDWTEMEGLFVTHWELSDDFVFSFVVYAPGHRVYVPERKSSLGGNP